MTVSLRENGLQRETRAKPGLWRAAEQGLGASPPGFQSAAHAAHMLLPPAPGPALLKTGRRV